MVKLTIDKIFHDSGCELTDVNIPSAYIRVTAKIIFKEVKVYEAEESLLDFIYSNMTGGMYQIKIVEKESSYVAGGFPMKYADTAFVTFFEESSTIYEKLAKIKLSN